MKLLENLNKNMKFKGTIIITDPCYVVKKCLDENPYPFPWTSDLIDSPNIDEMIKQYTEWKDTHDDWNKCECGGNMEALGISTYFTKNTIYGDWGCTTYRIEKDPYEVVNNLAEASEKGEDYWRVINDIYSYIDVINLTYDMPYIDLEKGFAIYKAVIKIGGKYYTFTYKEGPYCDYKEQAREEDIELTEVTPIKETVTKYI